VVFLFRDKSIINILFLVILSVGVHLHFFVSTPIVVTGVSDGILSEFLHNYIAPLSSTALFMVYQGLLLVQAIRLNMLLTDMRMFQNSSYTTAMAYVLLSGILPQWCSLSPALIANFLLIWIFIKLSRLYNHPSPKTLLFNTGLIVGASIICYHPMALLILVVLFALTVVRPFRLAEWVILLMGVLLPFYFLAAWLYLTDHFSVFNSYLPHLRIDLPLHQWNIPLIVSISILFILMITGLYYWQLSNNRMVIQIRKNWGVMIVMLLVLLSTPFIFPNAGVESAFMILVPMAAFTGNSFSYPRSLLVPNLLFWLSAAIIAWNNWVLIKN